MSAFFASSTASHGQIWDVDIYVRASREDGDKEQSETISNQITMLTDFVHGRPELRLHEIRKDDGISGVTFDRPGFHAVMDDVRSGAANCVVVKDLSRFGRDYIETGKYLEEIFPFMGVRFIAVNDNYDSMAERSAADDVVLPFKNLVNDTYAKDISIKVRSSKAVKRRNGDFVGPFAAYGYCKDPENKNQLIIDEGAAETVRQIFSWKLDGMSAQAIADQLNSKGVLSPMEYKKSIGLNFKTSFKLNKMAKWTAVAVLRILKNELYMGTMVQGRETTPNYKVKTRIYQPPEKWSRIANAHEPIIPVREFQLVQRLMQEDGRRAPGSDRVYPLSGRVYCGTCGSLAKRYSVTYNGKKYAYYTCPTTQKDSGCEKRRISESALEDTVLTILRSEIKLILDMEQALKQIEELAWEHRETVRLDRAIEAKTAEAEKCRTMKVSTYEDLRDGLITQDEFLQMKEDYSRRIEVIERDIGTLKTERAVIQEGLVNRNGWLALFHKYRNLPSLSRAAVVNLIDRIDLYPGKEIKVVLRYQDQLANMMEFLREQNASISLPRTEVS